ncbi:MAG TPA: TonB-dependent receptor [Candidatus Methylomirabilis sp.]|nr:TonB-dependent receptor [Candidatus Methylomirabilis sp.]
MFSRRGCPGAIPTLLLLSGLVMSLGSAARAQAPSPQEPELAVEEVVVTASRLADAIQELRRVPGQVYVITAQDIQRTQPSTVQEAIRQVPGVVLYDQNGNRFQPIVDLRGFNGQPNPTTSVFVDGVRVNEPDSNAVNFDLIPIQDVERIEVLPGAQAIFGRNALGGVINIVTKRGAMTPQTTLESAFGSFNHYRTTASTSGPLPRGFDYYLGLSLDRESGFRDFSDGRVSKATGKLGYRPSEATDLSLNYTYVNDRLEQASTLTLSELAQDRNQVINPGSVYANELSSVTFQAKQKLSWGFSLAGNGFYRQTSQELQNVGRTSVSRGIVDTGTTGGVLQLSHEAQVWGRQNRFVIGGELQHSGVNSALGGSFGLFPFTSKRLVDEDTAGAFAQDTFDLTSTLALTGAIRFDSTKMRFVDELDSANNGVKRFERATPRVGLTYTPWSVLTVYGNYGEGFRVPTTDELFAFGVGTSNADLKPVESQTFEIGFRSRPVSWLETTAAVFLTDVKDEIVFDPTVPPFGQNRNSPKSRRQGAELGLTLHPHERLDILLNYTLTDARFRSNAELSTGTVEKGDRVPLIPRNRVNGTLTVRPLAGMEVSLNGQYASRQVLLNDESNTSFFRIQDAFILNASASYTWRQFRWFIQGNNLTDKKYETFGILSGGDIFLMPAAGINVLGGMTIRFEGYY